MVPPTRMLRVFGCAFVFGALGLIITTKRMYKSVQGDALPPILHPKWVLMAHFSGDVGHKKHAEATWFRSNGDTGLLAFGEFETTHATCTLPSSSIMTFNSVKRAFMQAVRCFPDASFYGRFRDNATMDDVRELMSQLWNLPDNQTAYFGLPYHQLVSNGGYFLSKRAVIMLSSCAPSPQLEEDAAVSECMQQNGVPFTDGLPLRKNLFDSIQGPRDLTAAVHPQTNPPDLCVAITFRASDDPLKPLAHKNTAEVYASLRPRVQAFLAKPVPSEATDYWTSGVLEEAPETNHLGTPVLFSLLQRVRDACPNSPLIAYANSDILFDAGLLHTLDALLAWNQSEMLAVGRRSNHALQNRLTVDDVAQASSELFTDVAQDYFILTPRLVDRWRSMLPAYVIGRRGYDNALVDWAHHHSVLVDLTETVTALHQTTGDGNFAGHSPRNQDREYNVELPGALYDHGSTGHAHYATVKRDQDVLVVKQEDNTVVARASDNNAQLRLTCRGRPIDTSALPSPLFVTFGNAGFKEMLANLLCNLALFPPMHAHLLVMVTDRDTAAYLESLDTDIIIGLYPHPIRGAQDYETPDYVKLMLLRGKLLLQWLGPRVVVWLEADAEYFENLLDHPQIRSASTDLTLYWDGTMYGGGFIRFAATSAAHGFYSEIIALLEAGVARGDFTNDQSLLNSVLKTTVATHEEFDRCAFRSGTYFHPKFGGDYQAICKGKRPVVQQHNWIIGREKKIAMAKEHGAWFLQTETPLPVCRQRDLRVTVMTMDRPSSLRRLLISLKDATYPAGAKVDVRVSVDRRPNQSHDPATLAILAEFEWPHGVFETIRWEEPMGIYGQWVDSWPCERFPSALYRAAVLLEDDLEVSPIYYEWFVGAHAAYAAPDLGAVTGMRPQLVALPGTTLSVTQLVPAGVQAFAYRLIATWSLSPTYDTWKRFRAWVKATRASDPNFDPSVDGTIPGQWYREFKASGREEGMWEIWLLRFMHDQGLYTLYPWIEEGMKAVVCNWRERGLHYDGVSQMGRDYPLATSLPPVIMAQPFVPYVDWGLAFYLCVTGGSLQSDYVLAQIQQRAIQAKKLPRLAARMDLRASITQAWAQLSAIPLSWSDGTDDKRCAERYEASSTLQDAFQKKRAELETLLREQGMPVTEGFSAQVDVQVQVYQQVFSKPNVKSIAEIGFNGGHSALLMLMSNPAAEIQSFDIGQHAYARAAAAFLNREFPNRLLQVIWGDSTVTVPEYHAQNPTKRFDIVIVDGGHSYEVATADIINMKLISHPGTILIVDDTPCEEFYCVDRVIAEQEAGRVIRVNKTYSPSPGRGFLLAEYVFDQ